MQLEPGLEALRKALDAGFEGFSKIREDPNLAKLRQSPGFQPLLDQYDEPVFSSGALECAPPSAAACLLLQPGLTSDTWLSPAVPSRASSALAASEAGELASASAALSTAPFLSRACTCAAAWSRESPSTQLARACCQPGWQRRQHSEDAP